MKSSFELTLDIKISRPVKGGKSLQPPLLSFFAYYYHPRDEALLQIPKYVERLIPLSLVSFNGRKMSPRKRDREREIREDFPKLPRTSRNKCIRVFPRGI